jgi:hypothetical protein
MATDRAVFITALSLNKSLRQAIEDGDLSGGGGGGGLVEVMNAPVILNGLAGSVTGLSYFYVPKNFTVNQVKLAVYEKNGISSGNLVLDVKRNSTQANAGMTSILSAQATLDFATATDYQVASATISSGACTLGQWLRIDLTSVPSGFVGKGHVIIYGT